MRMTFGTFCVALTVWPSFTAMVITVPSIGATICVYCRFLASIRMLASCCVIWAFDVMICRSAFSSVVFAFSTASSVVASAAFRLTCRW